MNRRKLLKKVLQGSKNVRFKDFVALIEGYGFSESRVSGSHHIFSHPEVDQLVNIHSVGGQAKPYQVRQFLKWVEKCNLDLKDE